LGDKRQIRTTRKARRDGDFTLHAYSLHKIIVAAGKRVPLIASGWQHV
jgi:hypothetical protein